MNSNPARALVQEGLQQKIGRLRSLLAQMREVVVCFSGGVDSSYLLAEAVGVLGEKAVAFTAVSPSLAPEEGELASDLAKQLGAHHLLVETYELDDPRYASNPVNRCYFCKTEVYSAAVRKALELKLGQVLDGFNFDDRGDTRPGRRAARELGVQSPLDELEFTKANIRDAALSIDLPVWDKPALACLSSRFPYGTEITPERLSQVSNSERFIRALGFGILRVRYYGATARIEVASEELPRLLDPKVREEVERGLRAEGFTQVTIDPAGYRRGSLNQNLGAKLHRLGAVRVGE
jgi:uncharacterized protein